MSRRDPHTAYSVHDTVSTPYFVLRTSLGKLGLGKNKQSHCLTILSFFLSFFHASSK